MLYLVYPFTFCDGCLYYKSHCIHANLSIVYCYYKVGHYTIVGNYNILLFLLLLYL